MPSWSTLSPEENVSEGLSFLKGLVSLPHPQDGEYVSLSFLLLYAAQTEVDLGVFQDDATFWHPWDTSVGPERPSAPSPYPRTSWSGSSHPPLWVIPHYST